MKTHKIQYCKILAFLTIILTGGNAVAEMKVGFVDTAKLLESSPQLKSAQVKMEAEFAPREKEVVALQKEIHKMEEKMQKDAAVMSEDALLKEERKLVTKRRELKRIQEEFREDLNIRQNEILSKLQSRLRDAINDFAKKNKYDLILYQGVAYASKKVDITDQVLKQLK